MTSEQIIGLSLLAGAALLYWRDRRQQRQPAPPPPAPAEPGGLAPLFAKLDAPHSRATTIAHGRDTLDQFAADAEVGLAVIAVEPDSIISHSVLSDSDKVHAIAHLLDSLAKDTTASPVHRHRAQAALLALGLRSPTP